MTKCRSGTRQSSGVPRGPKSGDFGYRGIRHSTFGFVSSFGFRHSGLLFQPFQGAADVLDHAVLDGQFDQGAAVKAAAENFDQKLGQSGLELRDSLAVAGGEACVVHVYYYILLVYVCQ